MNAYTHLNECIHRISHALGSGLVNSALNIHGDWPKDVACHWDGDNACVCHINEVGKQVGEQMSKQVSTQAGRQTFKQASKQ